jgi:hypothetical protein
MFPNNPIFTEMMVRTKQAEIQRAIEGRQEDPVFRARSEVLVIVFLLAVLLWLFI